MFQQWSFPAELTACGSYRFPLRSLLRLSCGSGAGRRESLPFSETPKWRAGLYAANLALINSSSQFLGGLKLAYAHNMQEASLRVRRGPADLCARQIRYQGSNRSACCLATFWVVFVAAGRLSWTGVLIPDAVS